MARQPNSPWGKDHRVIMHAPPSALERKSLEIDGKEVSYDTYMAEQKRLAFAMRNRRVGK